MASLSRLWAKYPWKMSGNRVRTSNRMAAAGMIRPAGSRLRGRRFRRRGGGRLRGRLLGLQLLELLHVLLEQHLDVLGRLGPDALPVLRSEERRVGKEGRTRVGGDRWRE